MVVWYLALWRYSRARILYNSCSRSQSVKYGTYRHTYWGEGRLQIQDQVNGMLVAAICASESFLLRDSFGRDHTACTLQDSQDGCFQQPVQVKKLAVI